MAEKEKCEVKNFKFKRKDDSEKMEKPDCSKGRDKRVGIRKEGGEMDQSKRKEMMKNKDNGYRLEMSMCLPFALYHLHFAFNA